MPDDKRPFSATSPSESTEIPGLPKVNSTYERPAAPWAEAGLRKENLRRDIADAIEENKQKPPLSEGPLRGSHSSLRDEVIAGVIGGLIALPLCDASWHAIVTEGEPLRGIIGLAFGLPIGVAGLSYHWWKTKLEWVKRAAPYWGSVGLVLLFAYVAGPQIYRRAVQPSVLTGAIGVIPVGSAPLSQEHFVNPLHEDIVKWKIAEGLRAATTAGQLSRNCHVTIMRLQEPFAEDYAADFKRILDVVGWQYDEHFATHPVDKGISVRGIVDDVQSRACASTLAIHIQNNARNRVGGTLGGLNRWIQNAEAPDYLKGCDGGGIEVDFGNDDGL